MMLLVEHLNIFYGNIHALRDVSFSVEEGSTVSLVGANGAGKSTLLMALAGVLKPRSGAVYFDGRMLPREAHQVVRAGISLVPERRRLYANLTVWENLLMGAHVRRDRPGIERDMKRMAELFPIIEQRMGQYAGTLSGGEQQMVAIARALMSRPKLLLMDEPSLGLAPLMVQQVFGILQQLRGQGMTILLAEQNAYQALELSDRAHVLESGIITLTGTGRELLSDERVQRAYLGVKRRD